ncbi:iron-containing alcohol dehydrogenase family protein [Halobacillus litoralis]|uniref:iron-containing alcohol dehydrogenase family protein n=1 Tax=Halobacillus litoralis TaxID=45668 RepID=UPI00249107B2|nr:iron-containing alcohol dehydrogenase family protein [Halobacillus litoralis]
MESLNVQGAPAVYRCQQGVLAQLPDLLKGKHVNKAGLIHGEQSWSAAEPHIPDLPLSISYQKYNGECSHKEVERLCENLSGAELIIGVGGGKILDLAKASGDRLDKPVVLIPTLPSNCAAWTPLSVFYDETGNFEEYIVFPRSTLMVLVDPDLLLDSPVEYLRAGIGDTIAKWYEADVLTRHIKTKPVPLDVSLHAAKLCRDVLIENGSDSIRAHQQQEVDPSFIRVVETIILAGGMVGGFGDVYGRISGAHSVHNGLTKVKETHGHLHGDKVAYGTLVQLALEERFEEIERLYPFYQQIQLPKSLIDLGLSEVTNEVVQTIARYTTRQGESIHLMGVSEADVVVAAIQNVEELYHKQ